MRKIFVLWLLLLSVVSLAQPYSVKQLGIEKGLSNNYVVSIAQDKQGFLWFATEEGLNKFDGTRFITYLKNEDLTRQGITGNELNCLLDDPQDSILWIGTQRAGLNAYDYVNNTFLCYRHDGENPESLITDDVTKIVAATDGNLWITTYWRGVDYFDKKAGKFIHYNTQTVPGLASDNIWSVVDGGDGKLYMGHVHHGFSVLSLKDKKVKNFMHDPEDPVSLPGNGVTCIYKDLSGNIWLGTDRGLALFNPEAENFIHFHHSEDGVPHTVFDIRQFDGNKLWILKALQQTGYTTPTPIQEQAIPVLLKGKDLLGCAQTGTGKTAAFAIPLIQRLYQSDHKKGIKALILTPTRELAIQIGENFDQYAGYTGVKHAVIFGGVPQKAQVDALKRGVQVLIATPGRLLDLQSQGCISLKGLEYFVLDEADRMLDMGFIHDIKKVLKLIPARRQTLFFSATMPSEIEKLADSMLTNPEKIEVTPVSSTVDTIRQSVYFVEKKEKKDLLLHLLKNPEIESVLIFTRTKHGADKLARILNKSEIGAEAIHGNKSQNARQRALTNFKDHTTRVLIATDIAARGIDVNQLSHVINYELPNISETYVHRIGRTGRAGHDGIAISFCESEELPYLKDIQKLIGLQIPVVKDHPWVTVEGEKAQAGKTEELKEKAKANKVYRGSKSNGDYWRRKKQAQSKQGQGRQSSDRKASGRPG